MTTITVPKQTWDAMRGALEHCEDSLSSVGLTITASIAREALTAANAVSHPKTENAQASEGGAITFESDDADMLTIAYMDGFDAGKKSVQPQAQVEAIAWEATTPGYIKYVTDKQYRSYSETAKRYYKPYKCNSCHPQASEPAQPAFKDSLTARDELRSECSWCETCRPVTLGDMRMVVCPDCGNKRCPKATNHNNACTNSNDIGQKGSSWEHVKLAAPEARQ